MSETKQKAFCRDYERLNDAIEGLINAVANFDAVLEANGGTLSIPNEIGYVSLAELVVEDADGPTGPDDYAGPNPPYPGRRRFDLIVDRAEEDLPDHPFGVGPRSDDMYSEYAIYLREAEGPEADSALSRLLEKIHTLRDNVATGEGATAIAEAREKVSEAMEELSNAWAETMRKWKESAGKKGRRFGA